MQAVKYKDLEDKEIIALIREDDSNAIDFLMEKYKHLVRNRANKLFLIGGDKDDLIQEGMIGLYKAIRDFEPEMETTFKSFADLCVSRQMYTAIKLSNRKKNIPLNNYVSLYTPAFAEAGELDTHIPLLDIFFKKNCNPEELVIDKESVSVLEYELGRRLSPMEQKVLHFYLDGKNYREIAEEIGRGAKSVDNALQRIKSKLSSLLNEIK